MNKTGIILKEYKGAFVSTKVRELLGDRCLVEHDRFSKIFLKEAITKQL